MTLDQFVNREIRTWGEDYICDLVDRGYIATELTDSTGSNVKWTWLYVGTAVSMVATETTVSGNGGT